MFLKIELASKCIARLVSTNCKSILVNGHESPVTLRIISSVDLSLSLLSCSIKLAASFWRSANFHRSRKSTTLFVGKKEGRKKEAGATSEKRWKLESFDILVGLLVKYDCRFCKLYRRYWEEEGNITDSQWPSIVSEFFQTIWCFFRFCTSAKHKFAKPRMYSLILKGIYDRWSDFNCFVFIYTTRTRRCKAQ